PVAVWKGLGDQVPWAYAEAHDSAENDPRVLPDQASFKAAQDRHFFLEYTLSTIAKETGSAFVSSIVLENGWRYGIFRAGKVTFTQKCVGSYGEIPPPAKFRERLAESNGFIRQGKFAFMRDAVKVTEAEINGVLIHGPESRSFRSPGFSRPAFICYAVPFPDYSGWVAKYELAELVASYIAAQPKSKKPEPKWKSEQKRDRGKKGA
ncbi:MAG: hypothetical protein ABSD74_20585, partial [Rhizomicrobium sp.]